MGQKKYTVYHLPGPNYVGQTNRVEGARWASHQIAGKDIYGAKTVSVATVSTLNTREAYHIGAKDAFHHGANATRGNDLAAYYQGKADRGVGGSSCPAEHVPKRK